MNRPFAAPRAALIPRIDDKSGSFLYLDRLKISQDDTGVTATSWNWKDKQTLYLPVASIAAIVLGPGTSITTRAVSTITRHGASITWSGDGGVRTYATTAPPGQSTRWLERQAMVWADPKKRTEAIRRQFAIRFGDTIDTKGKTIEQMRGIEGSRMRQLYHALAKEHSIQPFRRSYNPEDWDTQGPVNKALSSANTCLYGIVRAAISATGCSPSLGYLHTGKQDSFVYDIADLYKSEITIPTAFALHASLDPEGDARRSFRERLHLFGLMPRIINDIHHIIDPSQKRSSDTHNAITLLWDQSGPVASGTNYGDTNA